jgi:uncharacterized membrane protein (GlpM family)
VPEEAVVLALKGLNGGLFVVVFALVAETLRAKRFAGLFAAAPSIALANLLVVAIADGESEALASADGMLIGAGAMSAACLAGTLLVRRANALRSSAALCVLWLLVAVTAYLTLEL